jgi:Sec-independent protein translocase protein TatA|tara:strand:+ start:1295 stop:1423 length:129 start_codon:yes stop_codon:yes gene_type:complete
MTISFGQIILILIVAILLFGNFSNILKEIAQGIKTFQETLKK